MAEEEVAAAAKEVKDALFLNLNCIDIEVVHLKSEHVYITRNRCKKEKYYQFSLS